MLVFSVQYLMHAATASVLYYLNCFFPCEYYQVLKCIYIIFERQWNDGLTVVACENEFACLVAISSIMFQNVTMFQAVRICVCTVCMCACVFVRI